ncbi:OPT family small oligopeptide transporter [Kwoniella mangroviensis CBS 8507]|uniref:OPT family small oligopeptide transporter n=1 Tax=Kwoniella mangroviensis CBS 8507 TaxID=1296122 RepID=UPI00080D7D5C|nr:OPT family small oligopeptide transporter [Kwoniella mangroviensis CBS 8507]OCF65135.1 OPT family small oligopeptide transporter [Kwoniella mangroviensis CBS 8507]
MAEEKRAFGAQASELTYVKNEKNSSLEAETEDMGSDKNIYKDVVAEAEGLAEHGGLDMTGEDILAIEDKLQSMSLERTRIIMKQVQQMHEHDQNFPIHILQSIEQFLGNDDIMKNPHNPEYAELIKEMKLEALMVTENSPYSEVRAVVENTDDVDMPSFTFRVCFIGTLYVIAGAFINQLFEIRQPSIQVSSEVAQLLAYPAGKLCEKLLPDWGFTLFGKRHSLNGSKFTKKEHMLITIMATVGYNTPYTTDIILSQYLPQYFNQSYAAEFGYQILLGFGTNFCGYGLAGLARRFLIYPSYCVWPGSLVTIALNRAFHSETDPAVPGPFKRIYSWSRMKLFGVAFAAMFVWFWLPGFLFTALSTFNWISWISPNSVSLNNIVGFNNGLGLNPFPTFDFNVLTAYGFNPLVVPAFGTINQFIGMFATFFMIVGFYWSNVWNTGYLPINSNHVFDNTGSAFDVQKVIDDRGIFDAAKYQTYSQPWMAAGNLVVYFWFFAQYTCTISYAFLFHRREIVHGFKGMWNSLRRNKKDDTVDDLSEDIHCRLMRSYPEVPEWWYGLVLLFAIGCGMAGIGAWDTYTNPAVVLFGIAMGLIFVVPVGLVTAITGIQVTMNVLAELIGGAWTPGNALAMNFFKAFGYITTAQAIYFSSDLKVAHYLKIPPRHTFVAQMVATFISTLVCTGVFNFQMNNVPNVCTSEAPFGFSCPGINTFFTAAVFWGTLGPQKLFGSTGQYKALLIGFPVGFVLPFIVYFLRKRFPRTAWLRQIHPVMLCYGGINWAPYNLSYFWPSVPLASFSWFYLKKRYLAFWSKYNFVLAAAWQCGIAIAAIVIFFAVQLPAVEVNWWGNTVSYQGCEDTACRRLPIPDIGYFGPAPGNLP